MASDFFDRVSTSYNNAYPIELSRLLEMKVGELAPGALPDLSDIRDVGVIALIRLTSPLVYLTILGKESTKTVIDSIRGRFEKIEIPETTEQKAQAFWDTDLPAPRGMDSNYYHEGRRTKDKFIP